MFHITKLKLSELVYKHQNNLLSGIYDSYFLNIRDAHILKKDRYFLEVFVYMRISAADRAYVWLAEK